MKNWYKYIWNNSLKYRLNDYTNIFINLKILLAEEENFKMLLAEGKNFEMLLAEKKKISRCC